MSCRNRFRKKIQIFPLFRVIIVIGSQIHDARGPKKNPLSLRAPVNESEKRDDVGKNAAEVNRDIADFCSASRRKTSSGAKSRRPIRWLAGSHLRGPDSLVNDEDRAAQMQCRYQGTLRYFRTRLDSMRRGAARQWRARRRSENKIRTNAETVSACTCAQPLNVTTTRACARVAGNADRWRTRPKTKAPGGFLFRTFRARCSAPFGEGVNAGTLVNALRRFA